jgi:hypothetical protein
MEQYVVEIMFYLKRQQVEFIKCAKSVIWRISVSRVNHFYLFLNRLFEIECDGFCQPNRIVLIQSISDIFAHKCLCVCVRFSMNEMMMCPSCVCQNHVQYNIFIIWKIAIEPVYNFDRLENVYLAGMMITTII